MSTFDPAGGPKAVAVFTPSRPQKFQDLFPAKDVIAELRQKRASYRAIAELLTKHCLPTSKTAVALFCHDVLEEIVRPRRRPGRKRAPGSAQGNGENTASDSTPASGISASAELSTHPVGDVAPPGRTRGPRIAQVRIAKPPST